MRHIKAGVYVNSRGKFFQRRGPKKRYIPFEVARERLEAAGVNGQDLEIILESLNQSWHDPFLDDPSFF